MDDLNRFEPPHYVIDLPTKRHWRGKSRLEDIEAGLKALVTEVRRLKPSVVTAAEASDPETYRRYLIVEAEMPVGQIAHLAGRLATFLNRPLLHHAPQQR